ncbi:MAG: TraB/GumN family protein [Paludibacter sp.]
MKKIIMLFFVLVTYFSLTQAQLLWKIYGNGLTHPSYLFGTHHLIPIQFLDSVPGLFKTFSECETVVGEMVLNNIDASAKIQQAAIMPNHKKISELMNQEEYKLVDNELKATLKFGLKEVSIMNPSLILTLYEMEKNKKLTGLSDDKQSDSYFQLVAEEKDKKVLGLETIDQQIAILFGNGSLERQTSLLVESIRKKNSMLKEMNQLNRLYKAGKLNDLLLLSKGKGEITDMTDEEFKKMVDDRNADWISKLPNMMQKSSCFIAVGALHLPGQNGLLKLLEKKGYKVSPISN